MFIGSLAVVAHGFLEILTPKSPNWKKFTDFNSRWWQNTERWERKKCEMCVKNTFHIHTLGSNELVVQIGLFLGGLFMDTNTNTCKSHFSYSYWKVPNSSSDPVFIRRLFLVHAHGRQPTGWRTNDRLCIFLDGFNYFDWKICNFMKFLYLFEFFSFNFIYKYFRKF